MFVAVADAGSFSEAARRLGVSPSAVSQAVNSLEERLGTALLRRSTRSLSLTDVGRHYLRTAAPALAQLRQAAEDAAGQGNRPAGPLRLTMPRAPFDLLVADALIGFQGECPGAELEIVVERRLVDIVREGYDAGFRYGNALDRDMAAVEVAPRSEAILVASPGYLGASSVPTTPDELLDHRAIMCRSQATGMLLPWVLRSAEGSVQIVPPSSAIIHDLTSQITLAIRGLGVVSAPAEMVADHLGDGRLSRVLPAWSSPVEPLFVYFPSRGPQSAALRAFIAFLRDRKNPAG